MVRRIFIPLMDKQIIFTDNFVQNLICFLLEKQQKKIGFYNTNGLQFKQSTCRSIYVILTTKQPSYRSDGLAIII